MAVWAGSLFTNPPELQMNPPSALLYCQASVPLAVIGPAVVVSFTVLVLVIGLFGNTRMYGSKSTARVLV